MKIILLIDHRESKIKQFFQENELSNVVIEYENLEFGDFIFVIEFSVDNTSKLVFERKSINDLASSIKDNRWRNQKQNLLVNFDRSQLYYIIEDHIEYAESNIVYSGISHNTIISSIINTMIRDDIKCFFTENLLDTINLLKTIATKLVKDGSKLINNHDKTTIHVAKKIVHNSKDKFFHNCLLCIPGLSEKIAQPLLREYNSLENFYNRLNCKDYQERFGELSQLRTETEPGKHRKISRTVLTNILDYFWD